MNRDLSTILGEPGKGIHKHFFGIAIADVLFTIAAAFLLHRFYPKYSVWFYLIVLFVLGIILHRLFGVKTTVDKFIFGN
jgi:hypothetical protein